MLTKNDLSQIRQVVKGELGNYATKDELRQVVKAELDTKLKDYPTKKDMNKGFEKLTAKLEESFDYLDKRFIKHNSRLQKIETHLGLPVQSSL